MYMFVLGFVVVYYCDIVYCDFKLLNVFVNEVDEVKFVDFGFVKQVVVQVCQEVGIDFVGMLYFMVFEFFVGSSVMLCFDVYVVGIIFYYLFISFYFFCVCIFSDFVLMYCNDELLCVQIEMFIYLCCIQCIFDCCLVKEFEDCYFNSGVLVVDF